MPFICPSGWSRCYDVSGTWTRHEILKAFKKLEGQQLLALKFCLFVNGVDECEDYTDIIKILKRFSTSPSVKICVSSRPWNIFTAAFGVTNSQRLVLEDLNKADIQNYITSRFGEDENFVALKSREPNSSYLAGNIIKNAEGVFLWVKIVVGNLLRGISNDDSLSDLHQRLQSFPTTLTAYYQHMFDTIDDVYREKTAELLLLCLEGTQPFSLLNIWFYEQEKISPEYGLQAETSLLDRADVVCCFNRIHKRINAKGQDLLVIEADMTADSTDQMYTIRFTHSTVKDFLSKDFMLERLTAWTSKGFDARVTLCYTTCAMVKSLLPSADVDVALRADHEMVDQYIQWRRHACDFFTYASLLEQNEAAVNDTLTDAFQRFSCLFLKPYKEGRDFSTKFLSYDLSARACDKFNFPLALIAEKTILDQTLHSSSRPVPTPKLDKEMIQILLTGGPNSNERSSRPYYGHDASSNRRSILWRECVRHSLPKLSTDHSRASESTKDQYQVAKLLINYEIAAEIDFKVDKMMFHALLHKPTHSNDFRKVIAPHDPTFPEQHVEEHKPKAIYLRWWKRVMGIVVAGSPLIYHVLRIFTVVIVFILVAILFPSV